MNILFYMAQSVVPERGGINRMTDVLMRAFSPQHQVYCLMAKRTLQDDVDNHYYLPHTETLYSEENIKFAQCLQRDLKIDIIINQEGISPTVSLFILLAKADGVKCYTVIHNTLTSIYGSNGHLPAQYTACLPSFAIKTIDKLMHLYFRRKYRKYFDCLVSNSDKIIMLCKSLESNLEEFLGRTVEKSKITSIPNPVTLQVSNTHNITKEKRLLFVGRLSYEKQPLLLLQIWKLLEPEFPEWTLDIVGYGALRTEMEKRIKKDGLKRVRLYGFQSPESFYTKASIFCMTSSFEGMPLTILESMAFGTVPVIFNSFLSAKDMVQDGHDGFLIPPYQKEAYVNALKKLMTDSKLLNKCSVNCVLKAQVFSLAQITARWNRLMEEEIKK